MMSLPMGLQSLHPPSSISFSYHPCIKVELTSWFREEGRGFSLHNSIWITDLRLSQVVNFGNLERWAKPTLGAELRILRSISSFIKNGHKWLSWRSQDPSFSPIKDALPLQSPYLFLLPFLALFMFIILERVGEMSGEIGWEGELVLVTWKRALSWRVGPRGLGFGQHIISMVAKILCTYRMVYQFMLDSPIAPCGVRQVDQSTRVDQGLTNNPKGNLG